VGSDWSVAMACSGKSILCFFRYPFAGTLLVEKLEPALPSRVSLESLYVVRSSSARQNN